MSPGKKKYKGGKGSGFCAEGERFHLPKRKRAKENREFSSGGWETFQEFLFFRGDSLRKKGKEAFHPLILGEEKDQFTISAIRGRGKKRKTFVISKKK